MAEQMKKRQWIIIYLYGKNTDDSRSEHYGAGNELVKLQIRETVQ